MSCWQWGSLKWVTLPSSEAWKSSTAEPSCPLLLCCYLDESQNPLGWKRSPSPAFNPPLTSPPLNHVTKSHVYMSFKSLQGWWCLKAPMHFIGQPMIVPMIDISSCESFFLISNLNLPGLTWDCFLLFYCLLLGRRDWPHVSATSFQIVTESRKVLPESPSLQAEHPSSLSHSSQGLCSRALSGCVTLFWTHSSTSMSFFF